MSLLFTTILSLVGSTSCVVALAWHRRWLMAIAFACSTAYTVFDKVLPNLLPEPVVDCFVYVFAGLVLLELIRKYPGRARAPQGKVATAESDKR